ncbi:MAG: ArsR/SmtB family transcription factor [Candidatus Bipolaricaulia bacterium]
MEQERLDLNKEAYKLHAQVCSVMANPKRLQIIDLLSEGEKSVEELTQRMGINKANVSQHLTLLRQNNLVTTRKQGLYVYYRIVNPKVVRACQLMKEVATEQLLEMQRIIQGLREQGEVVEELTLEELRERMEAGEVILLDVRPADEYEAGHIQGAISLPVEEIDRRWKELVGAEEIVAYCRGPYCTLSDETIAKLKRYGITGVKRLANGFPQWAAAGYPVERGERVTSKGNRRTESNGNP